MRIASFLVVSLALAGCDEVFDIEHVGPVAPAPKCTIGAGRRHTCITTSEGRVFCWGLNDDGQVQPGGPYRVLAPNQISLPERALEVVAGRSFSCARLVDDSVWCWGSNFDAQHGTTPSDAPGPTRVSGIDPSIDIDAGGYHICSRSKTDRSVSCWGANDDFETGSTQAVPCGGTDVCALPSTVPSTAQTRSISLGHRHTCAIDKDEALVCWGRNHHGQLGDKAESRAEPMVIPTLGKTATASLAGRFSCALGVDGVTRCWGGNDEGQLGTSSFDDTSVPTALPIPSAKLLAAGGFGGCVAHEDGAVSCWGSHDAANGSSGTNPEPVRSLVSNPSVLESGFHHSCAVVGAEIVCWGNDDEGQLGRGMRGNVGRYTPLSLPAAATQVDVGNSHACATTQNGLYCWGENDHAEAGNAQLQNYYEPTLYTPGIAHTGIRMSFNKSCVLGPTGGRCWGRTANGSAGTGTSQRHSAGPLPVVTTDIVELANGHDHQCTLDTSGQVRCYGYNGQGQLGSPGPTSTSGRLVTLPGQPSDVTSGERHSCALIGTTAYCWGSNRRGQLGDGTVADRDTPMPVVDAMGAMTFAHVGCGRQFCCGRHSPSNEIYCWGDNTSGQIGDGSNVTSRTTPTKTTLPMTAQYVVVGQAGACAKLINGTFYCWGDNDLGQMGNDTGADIRTPVLIPELTGTSYLSIGERGSCAISAGTVMCTGDTRLLANGDRSRSMALPPVLPVAPACQ